MGLLKNISRKETKIQIEEIEIAKIIPDPSQARKNFSGLKELANTIKKHGLQNPIHVRPQNNQYIIISGERRWRACREYTDFTVIQCYIITKDIDEKKIRYLQLIENIQRQDLTPLEEAHAYKSILESGEIKQRDLASEIGMSETVISKSLRLTTLPEAIQTELQKYPVIPKAVLLEIAKEEKTPEFQLELWDKVKSGDLTKREDLVEKRRERKQRKTGFKKKDLQEMDEDEVLKIVLKAVQKDKGIIKKLLNAAQFGKIFEQENEK